MKIPRKWKSAHHQKRQRPWFDHNGFHHDKNGIDRGKEIKSSLSSPIGFKLSAKKGSKEPLNLTSLPLSVARI